MAAERRVSVVIPSFGRNDEVIRAVRSALAQTSGVGEVIVVDDASPEPIRIPESGGDVPVRIVRHEANLGAAAARNSGVAAAELDLVAFLDSDDVWRPAKTARQLAAMREPAEPGTLWASATGFTLYDVGSGDAEERVPIPASDIATFAAGCWFCPGSTLIVPKSAFERVGPFDTSLRRLEDYEWFLRFALAGGRLSVTPEVLADIHVARQGRSLAYGPSADRIETLYADRISDTASRNHMRAYLALERAADCRRNGRWACVMRWLARSFWLKPRLGLQVLRFWPPPDAKA